MAHFQTYPPVINVLVCYDVDTASVLSLAERFVSGPSSTTFDAIVVVGPFIHTDVYSKEDLATAEGDMASILAQLENISCRVIYLPAASDPPSSLVEQLHLTPNSVNIFARRLTLREGLFITGHTEVGTDLEGGPVPPHMDRTDESDDELENVEVKNSTSSMAIIREILLAGDEQQQLEMKEAIATTASTASSSSSSSTSTSSSSSSSDPFAGIFVLNYLHVHTLNYFLFHMEDDLKASGITVCIIPCCTEEAVRLPGTIFGKTLVVPQSLKNGGHYATLCMEKSATDGRWLATNVEHCKLG
jgi:hypothetical protein